MQLTPDEQAWLNLYCHDLVERYPDTITQMVIYGSKARGDSHPDSDLDVLLIVRNEADALRRPLRRLQLLVRVGTRHLGQLRVQNIQQGLQK